MFYTRRKSFIQEYSNKLRKIVKKTDDINIKINQNYNNKIEDGLEMSFGLDNLYFDDDN